MSLLWRLWRTVATLSCFSIFALGGLALGMVAIPMVRLVRRDDASRHRAGRWIVYQSFRFFIGYMRRTGVLNLRIEGAEALRKPGALLLANHPTLIDFVILGSLIPNADCFVKSSLKKDWFKRWPVTLAGYILNDQGEKTIQRCRESLDEGNNMIIFPEGTRTVPGQPLRFQRGAAQVAVRTGQNVTPVLIACRGSNLEKGGAWYLAPRRQLTVVIKVREEIPIRPFLEARPDQPALAARDFNDYLQDYFNKGLDVAFA